VRARLDAGDATIDERGSGGQTALMSACLNGHADVALLLLERGADATIGEGQGYTCVLFARSQRPAHKPDDERTSAGPNARPCAPKPSPDFF